MNPIIKFTTLFGLLAVELAVTLTAKNPMLAHVAGRRILPGVGVLRAQIVLWHED